MPAERLKLGQLLLRREMLSEDQLAKALENQIIYGGRLGTNLVELGFIRLEDVGRCLVIQRGVRQAGPDMLGEIPADVLALLPAQTCSSYGILPLRHDRAAIHLGMIDPAEEAVIKLQTHFGRPVTPYVVPEFRMHYFIERHYGIERPKRFLRLPDGGERDAGQRKYLAPTVQAPQGARTPVTPNANPRLPSDLYRRVVVAPITRTAPDRAPPPNQAPPPPPSLVRSPTSEGHPAIELVYLDQLGGNYGQPSAAQATPERRPIDDVVEELLRAATGGEIAKLLVKPLCDELKNSVLFWVRGHLAVACCAEGTALSTAQLGQLVIPLDSPSMFKMAVDIHGVVHGQGEDDAIQEAIARFLGAQAPGEVCIAPVSLDDKIVNLICLHSQPGVPFPESLVADLRTLASSAQLAYDRLRAQLRR